MSSLMTNSQPARRLLPLASRSACCQNTQCRGTSITTPFLQFQRRQYAEAARRTTRGSSPNKFIPLAEKIGVSSEDSKLLFSKADVPSIEEWAAGLEVLQIKDLTAEQCQNGATRYVSVVTKWELHWRGALEEEYKLNRYLLHYMGCILLTRNSADRWRLGTHMLKSASAMGFDPSVLTLVRVMSSLPKDAADRAAKSAVFKGADARFQELIRLGRDPDALTLYGIILAGKGQDEQAIKAFRNAEKAAAVAAAAKMTAARDSRSGSGSKISRAVPEKAKVNKEDEPGSLPAARESKWDWELSCVLGQARILLKHRKLAEAEKMFRVAALELDNPEGYLYLAQLMKPRDSPERETYLMKAAISGRLEAFQQLGELEKFKSQQKGLAKAQVVEHERMAKEWFGLADIGGSNKAPPAR